jgi:hypothetical protein
MQDFWAWLYPWIPSIQFWIPWLAVSILLFVLFYIRKYGGIRSAVWYQQKGGTARWLRATEDEKTVSAGDLTWSKVRQAKDGKKTTYVAAAEPIVAWRGFWSYRVFRVVEGFPTVIPWDVDVPIAPLTADELGILQRGGLAKGLVQALISRLKRDWVVILMAFLLGVFFMLGIHPFIFH